MSITFFNVRTAEETIDRMVLSVVVPFHRDAYTQSCYAYVCHEVRTNAELKPTDRIVLLGLQVGEGVIHSVLVRGNDFIVDACSDSAVLEGGVYTAPSTRGAEPIKMYVKGDISVHDFGVKCLKLIADIRGYKPLQAPALKNT